MKYFLVLMAMVAFTAQAQDTPSVFKDSDIKRTLKDGSVQQFDGDEYAIVKRGVTRKPKTITKTVVVERTIYKKNEVRLLGGAGPKGIEVKSTQGAATVDEDRGLILGIGYSRRLSDDFSLGADVFNNDTVLLEFGFHF